jgi:hypothetical protein
LASVFFFWLLGKFMNINDLIDAVGDKLESLGKEGLVDLWNTIFPVEEHISLLNLVSDSDTADIKKTLAEEIALADTKKILKVYNKLTGEELTIEEMDSDEEGWEPSEQEGEE